MLWKICRFALIEIGVKKPNRFYHSFKFRKCIEQRNDQQQRHTHTWTLNFVYFNCSSGNSANMCIRFCLYFTSAHCNCHREKNGWRDTRHETEKLCAVSFMAIVVAVSFHGNTSMMHFSFIHFLFLLVCFGFAWCLKLNASWLLTSNVRTTNCAIQTMWRIKWRLP